MHSKMAAAPTVFAATASSDATAQQPRYQCSPKATPTVSPTDSFSAAAVQKRTRSRPLRITCREMAER